MGRRRSRLLADVALAGLLVASPWPTAAYEVITHMEISRRAAEVSTVDSVLKEQLSIGDGLTARFRYDPDPNSRTERLLDWVREGADLEDAWVEDVLLRFLRHFHDPLRPWEAAGFGLGLRASSAVLWGQNPDQSWSWPKVRQHYLTALTHEDAGTREAALARAFRGLGQVIHLVQDMASPAHVRNDAHPLHNYEKAVETLQRTEPAEFARWLGHRPPGFDPAAPPDPGWAALDRHPAAPVPIARLFDTDRYSGANPDVTMAPLIGLAEYTQANFLSEDTGFHGRLEIDRFPYPARSSVVLQDHPVQLPGGDLVLRRYYVKARDGDAGYRLGVVGFLHDHAVQAGLDPVVADARVPLDEAVYRDYAERLVPRAVAYSTAMLDYFFRGRLELTFDRDPADPTRTLVTVHNGADEPLGPGTIGLYSDSAEGQRSGHGQLAVADVPPRGEVGRLSVPDTVEAAPLVAVYRGALGTEADAVVGRVEPTVDVEQIFRGGTDWMLRTADGIFPLGLGLGPGRVKWGDRDNLLVSQTFLPGEDQLFQVYEIRRPEGSRQVPRRPDGTVDLSPVGPPARLGGDPPLDLGTTVHFHRATEYRQQLLTFTPDLTAAASQWFGPIPYVLDRTFRLTLPVPIPGDTLHVWQLTDFSASRAGDVVGVFRVELVGPPGTQAPIRRHVNGVLVDDFQTGAAPAIDFLPPPTRTFMFTVNLTRRSVIAKTSEDFVTVEYRTVVQVAYLEQEAGGGHAPVLLGPASDRPPVATAEERYGPVAIRHPGLYRSELVAAGFTPPVIVEETARFVWALSEETAVEEIATFGSIAAGIMYLRDARRADGPGEGYVLLGWAPAADDNTWVPLRWYPGRAEAVRQPAFTTVKLSDVSLADAARRTAMLEERVFSPSARRTHLVAARADHVFPARLATTHDLLEPDYLYGRTDLRFHRISPTLEALAGPRPLVAGGPGTGEFHVVGRR